MSAERFLITGCGRSGTGYTATLLTALGLRCGHEEIFSIRAMKSGRVAWPDTYLGESSWLAAPFLSELPAGTAVLHQVRDPLAVVRSFVRIRLFETPGPYLDFLADHLEGIDRLTPVEAALLYWERWNAMVEEADEIERLSYHRYRLEEIGTETIGSLLDSLGHPVEAGELQAELERQPTNYNTCGDRARDGGIRWDTLPDGAVTRAVAERAIRYGYPGLRRGLDALTRAMTNLSRMTWVEARALVDPRTVALLPLGATEPHGPHLPLDTDVVIAVATARRAAERLEEAGVQALRLPPLAYGITRLAQDYAGGVTMRPGTLWAFVEDLLLSLQQDGVRQLVVCNAHLEADQRRILRGLAIDYPERGPGRCQLLFPDRADLEGKPLEEGKPDTSCHGGRGETSLMLAVDPDAVRREALSKLQPVTPPSLEALRARGASLRHLGIEDAYLGDPASATAAEGAERLEDLARGIVEAVRVAWPDLFAGSVEAPRA